MVWIAAVLGLLCGSFANVLIARVPTNEQWWRGSSHCMACGHDIAWYDNVPLVSWIVLGAKCRHCKARISVQYPLVEVATAVLFAVTVWRFGLSALAITLLYLAIVSVALSVIDLQHGRLPNQITYPTYLIVLCGLIAHAVLERDFSLLARGGIGMVALAGFYYVMRIASRRGMGLGDVMTAGFLGLVLGAVGWSAFAVGAIAGPLIGGVAGIVAMIASRRARGVRIPYGPWLIAGAWLGLICGDVISDWYLGIVTLTLS